MTEVETWRELTCGVIEVTMKRPRAGIDDPHPPPSVTKTRPKSRPAAARLGNKVGGRGRSRGVILSPDRRYRKDHLSGRSFCSLASGINSDQEHQA
jgi:hypothetical protein